MINNNFESCNKLGVEMQEVGQQLNLESYATMIGKLFKNFDDRFSDINPIIYHATSLT